MDGNLLGYQMLMFEMNYFITDESDRARYKNLAEPVLAERPEPAPEPEPEPEGEPEPEKEPPSTVRAKRQIRC